MTRTLIAYLVCSVLALVGVSGAHVHSHGNEHVGGGSQAAERDLDADEGFHAFTDLDADHLLDHAHHGGMDIDRQAKAFANVLPAAPLLICALWFGFLAVAVDGRTSAFTFSPPLRPPRARSRFFVFPPSHAPPALLI